MEIKDFGKEETSIVGAVEWVKAIAILNADAATQPKDGPRLFSIDKPLEGDGFTLTHAKVTLIMSDDQTEVEDIEIFASIDVAGETRELRIPTREEADLAGLEETQVIDLLLGICESIDKLRTRGKAEYLVISPLVTAYNRLVGLVYNKEGLIQPADNIAAAAFTPQGINVVSSELGGGTVGLVDVLFDIREGSLDKIDYSSAEIRVRIYYESGFKIVVVGGSGIVSEIDHGLSKLETVYLIDGLCEYFIENIADKR